MANMSKITIEFPDGKFATLKALADKENISVQKFMDRALNEAIDARRQLDYLKERAKGGSMESLRKILTKVPTAPPLSGD
jgi:hypothetical protein